MINYTESFKKKFKEVYGDIYDIYLDSGSNLIGKILKEESELRLSPTEIIECSNLDKLKEKAERAKVASELYVEYWSQSGV